jgi:hypothetical protein
MAGPKLRSPKSVPCPETGTQPKIRLSLVRVGAQVRVHLQVFTDCIHVMNRGCTRDVYEVNMLFMLFIHIMQMIMMRVTSYNK